MQTLILSCNTGAGHNSCAQAVQEAYHSRGEICNITDSLQFKMCIRDRHKAKEVTFSDMTLDEARQLHTRSFHVTGVQTCALPISIWIRK